MKRTIYLPEDLERQIAEYLDRHPELTFSGLVQRAVRRELAPPDPRAILKLAGLVGAAATQAGDRAEDRVARRER